MSENKKDKAVLGDYSKLKFKQAYLSAKVIHVRVGSRMYPVTKETIMKKAEAGTLTNGELSRFTPESVLEAKKKPTAPKKPNQNQA